MTNPISWNEIAEILDQNDDYDSLRAALEKYAPKPGHPEHMLGLWAKHPEHGDVLVTYDRPVECGEVLVKWANGSAANGTNCRLVDVSELTFPHQATKPEDVEPGEAWLVNVDSGKHSGERVVALKCDDNDWRTGDDVVRDEYWWENEEVTLIAPLVPARPEPEPQPEHPHVQQEPPADMQGWWATNPLGQRVLVGESGFDPIWGVMVVRAGESSWHYEGADRLTDWSHERDIKGTK